jgi:tape measure domain-containing protein
MSGEIGYAVLPIIPSLRGVGAEINKQISAPMSSAGGSAGRSLGSSLAGGIGTGLKVVGGLVAAVGGSVAAVALKGGISRALNIQDAQASLKGLGHDTESITGIMNSALGAVRGTAFGLDQAAGVAAGAVAAGIKPGQELQRTLTLTADAATIAKTSMGEMGSIFNKVATGGKLTTEVVNQLQDRGIPVLQLVAKQYGVTAEAASEMVTKGEVDFENFQAAMESGLGGAALKSGDTARGAFANVGAALSRVGAMFVGPAITGAPTVLQAITGAIDRGATALQPYAEAWGAKLAPALQRTAAFIDTIDLAKPIAGVQGLYDILVKGDFNGNLTAAFGWAEDDKPVDVLLRIRAGLQGVKDLVTGGDFAGAFAEAFNIQPDAGIIKFFGGIRGAVTEFFSSMRAGDSGAAFASIGTSLSTLSPAIAGFAAELPKIGQATATLAGAGITVLTTVLSFLADNVDTILQFMPLIVAGFIAWRVATAASATATFSLRSAELAVVPITFASNVMRLTSVTIEGRKAKATLASAAATRIGTAAEVTANGAKGAGLLATGRQLVATVATRGAQLASAAATGVATAAQWLWNAALTANPIGIVIVLIAALVAAIVWVATQTTFFQDAWTVTTAAIGAAVSWLWTTVISPVFAFIGAIFVWIYNSIILPIVTGIVAYFTMWANIAMWLWTTIISPVFNFIAAIFTWIWTAIIQVIIVGIVLYVTMWANIITWLWTSVISPVFNFIGAIFNWILNSIIMPIVNSIVAGINTWATIINWLWNSVISPTFNFIGNAFSSLWSGVISPFIDWVVEGITSFGNTAADIFNGFASMVGDAFSGALNLARGPLNGMIDLVNGAIGAINGISVEIPSFLPGGGGTVGFDLPTIPRLARGGNIAARPRGTLAILGEAGRAETVSDLGKTNAALDATRALAERATGSGESTDESVHFHGPVSTLDERELARKIQERKRRARLAKGGGRK